MGRRAGVVTSVDFVTTETTTVVSVCELRPCSETSVGGMDCCGVTKS